MHRAPRQEPEEQGAHRPDVRAPVDVGDAAERLLRRHERRRPHDEPSPRALRASVVVGAHEQASDPEVEHFDRAVLGHEQVCGLDVAVHEPFGVGRGEDVEDLIGDRDRGAERRPVSLPLPESIEARPLQELHDEERRAVLGHVVVEDRDGARVIEAVREVPFAHEALLQIALRGELGVEDLHREALLVPVRRGVDRGHTADPEDLIEPVLAADRGADSRPSAGGARVFGRGPGHLAGECTSPSSASPIAASSAVPVPRPPAPPSPP